MADASHDRPPAEADDDLSSVPSDVVAALRLLQAQFPRTSPGCAALPPVLLLTQLYSLVADRTAVDRETHALVASGTLRVLKLTTGHDERGFLFADDYAALVDAAASAPSHDADAAAVLQAFKTAVLPACNGATLALKRLEAVLADAAPASCPRDAQLRVVMTHGFLVRGQVASHSQPPVLYFTAPQLGAFQRSLIAGRAAILRFLARKPQRRALRSAVEALKLRACILPVRCRDAPELLLCSVVFACTHPSDIPASSGHVLVIQAAFVVRDMLGQGSLVLAVVPLGDVVAVAPALR